MRRRWGAALGIGLLALVSGASAGSIPKDKIGPFDPSAVTCDGCMLMAAFLSEQISDDEVDVAMLKRLESLCAFIPGDTAEDECKELVMQKGMMFLALLKAALMDPNAFCQDLGLCPVTPPKDVAEPVPRRSKQHAV